MRACRYHALDEGLPLRVEDVPVPEPGNGEVLVRTRYASLNPVDWKIASGKFRLLVRRGLPRTMGSDFSGTVAALGPAVDGWSLGERVMGFVDPFQRPHGSFAEFVPVPADFLFRTPDALGDPEAAALAAVGATAVALCTLGRVGPGSRVLVNGASGGVGHVAVQVAKLRGAQVTATASARRRRFLESLGADALIDYATSPVDAWPGGFDAVLDCVPNLPRHRHAALLRTGGHYASTLPDAYTYTLDPVLNRLGRLHRHAVMLAPDATAMDELRRGVEHGRLRCHVEQEFPLDEVAAAIERSRAGHVAGKLVIRIA